MKLTARLDGLDRLVRLDPAPLVDRLRAEIERELQASSPAPHDLASRRAALALALRRLSTQASPRA